MGYEMIYNYVAYCDELDCGVGVDIKTTSILVHKHLPPGWSKTIEGKIFCSKHSNG